MHVEVKLYKILIDTPMPSSYSHILLMSHGGFYMRRIAKPRRFLPVIAFTITALISSLTPAQAAEKTASVIIKVTDVSHVDRLARKYGLNIKKTVIRGAHAAFVVEGLSEGQLKRLLKDEPGFAFAEENKVIPLDGGETVLPLDGGETVLPLDGGETVLPLGSTEDQFISQLLDGGETVLPLGDLTAIRNAYAFMAGAITPSSRLLLQPAFRNIGVYRSIPKVTGKGVIIADIDTGADTCHEALVGVVTYTFVAGPDANAPENCATASTPAVPGFGHGTRVASLLRLVAPEATIWSMRVFDNSGSAQTSDIYQAVIYAADHGVNVINMSFGTPVYSQTLQDATDYARSRGVTLIGAGGNSNAEPLMYPALNSGVTGVVAVTTSDVKVSFSNYGKGADLSAPGYGLWAAQPNHQLAYVAGTSYASPLVAGEAALVIDAYQRTFRGQPSPYYVNWMMSNGVQSIDSLNPSYVGKLGHGRIYIPLAVGISW
jgi:subtilisin family serine protease